MSFRLILLQNQLFVIIFFFSNLESTDRQRVFQILIKNNADVNTVNDVGETPLFFVARFGGKYRQLLSYNYVVVTSMPCMPMQMYTHVLVSYAYV